MMVRRLFVLSFILFMIGNVYAYDTGKKPFRAMVLSAVIPGAGQIYNESYYKAGGFIALQGFFIGSLIYNHRQVNRYYDKALDSGGEEYHYNIRQHNKHFDRRQNDMWWLGTVVFLSAVDAFVDANLYNYEQEKESVYFLFEDMRIGVGYRW